MTRQLFWFGVVGVSAMLVHFLTVTVLVPLGVAPLLANVPAFLIAFQVSYWGHRRLTFRVAGVAHRRALPRFFAVACLGFGVNEALYFVLLRFAAVDYRIGLAVVLVVAAALTFALSKWWAFAAATGR